MSKWAFPPKAKIYEAFSAVADRRVQLNDNRTARVKSSDESKSYTVEWSEDFAQIISNDNASYWQGYLGYPSIAVLMELGRISFDRQVAETLASVAWKKINKKFKNNYDKAIDFVFAELAQRGISRDLVDAEVDRVLQQLMSLQLERFPKRIPPPTER